MLRLSRFGAGLIGLALLVACASAPAEPARPLLWKVSDADNHIYLLGSFHLLTPQDYPLPAAVDAAFADAEQVVFELPPAQIGDPGNGQKMLQLALRQDGRSLQDSLPPELWQRLDAYCRERGLPLAQWQGYQAWFVSLLLSMHAMQQIGLDPELGLDRHLAALAEQAHKPGTGLESLDDQLKIFAGMSAAEQEQSLREVLDKGADFETETRALHALWRAGDGERLYAEMGRELQQDYPALYQRVQRERNLAWLPQLKRMLDDSRDRDSLVVVGAMHLLGPDGLLALLRAQGYTVSAQAGGGSGK